MCTRCRRGIFGARFAFSYAVIIFLTTSSAITVSDWFGVVLVWCGGAPSVSLTDCLGVVVVWLGGGSSSFIGVHVLR